MAGGSVQRTLLLVDDEAAQARLVTAMASRAGWRTLAVTDGRAAIAVIDAGQDPIDAVLIDMWRPGEGGAELVGEMRERWPALPIVVLTAQASIQLAVEAMRAGATDFLLKPIAPHRLLAALEAAAITDAQEGELRPLAEKATEPLGFDEIVGSAASFRTALAIAAKAARGRGPVLIEGEPGTGKELIARAIHAASARGRRPAAIVHIDALAPAHAEAELFGHERGAFAGAFERNEGRIAAAEGSTLVLVGVAALPPEPQARLLTLIDQGLVMPPGATQPRVVDVRVIALTDRPLAQEVAAGRFDAELARRLGGTAIRVPPLRARPTDVPALTRHLLTRIGRQPGLHGLGLTDEALVLLARHPWPGNVRQLHNTLFRAAINARGDALTVADFPQVVRASAASAGEEADGGRPLWTAASVVLHDADGHIRPLDDIEADIIRLAIGHYEGRMSEVARRLRIGRSTLYRKLVELGLDSAA